MQSNLILTPAQAKAVYSAMCALNNIGAVIDVEIPGGCGGTRIQGTFTGSVRVEQRWDDRKSERYPDQDAFAAAYGLSDPDDNAEQPNELRAAAERAMRLFDEALPKFNWGASFLDANAIRLLNEVPAEVAAALRA